MNEQDEFAIKFGIWLSDNCDTSAVNDIWLYYADNFSPVKKKRTRELLKIFKDEMDKEN